MQETIEHRADGAKLKNSFFNTRKIERTAGKVSLSLFIFNIN